MWRRTWNPEDLKAWATRCGLSLPMVADILGLTKSTAHRILAGRVGVKDRYAELATAFETASRTTTGRSGDSLDGFADDEDFAALCDALPHAHVATLTSAIARGWTSAMTNGWRHMCQPIRLPSPDKVERLDIEWTTSTDLPWGVECRLDASLRPYRIASAERTILDLIAEIDTLGEDVVIECIEGAFKLADQTPDVAVLREQARLRGGDLSDLLNAYTREYA